MNKKYYKIYLPKFLKPKKNYLLERIGKNNDGGYLVCPKSIKNSSLFVFWVGLVGLVSLELYILKLISL